ncbi:hypothetical protein Tco_0854860 [Tanacetum coccineum]
MTKKVDTYDLEVDDAPTSNTIFMEKLSPNGSIIRDDVGPYNPPSKKDLDILFKLMFDEYFKPSPSVLSLTLSAATLPQDTTSATSLISISQDAPSPKFDSDTFTNPSITPKTSSAESSSRIVDTSNMHTYQQLHSYIKKWTTDHPLATIIGNPSNPISTRCQLATDAMWCYFHAFLTKKYGLENSDAVDTPMMERSKHDEDPQGTQVDLTRYRNMAEAINTTCYVQNRVLVVKPHNKTPYELFHGRKPTLSFMRPFGYPGIKSFLMLFGITTVLIDVNAAQSKLVVLENFNENYSKFNAAEGVNAASEEVSTAELVSTAYVIHRQNISDPSNFNLSSPRTSPCLASVVIYSKFKCDNLRCQNQDLVFDAFSKRQMGEDNNISSKDNAYKFEPLDLLSSTQKFLDKVDELRAVSGHMPGASRVQIPENNLDSLKLTREVDGEFEIVDPYFVLGFEMLDGLDPKILSSLLKSTNFATLVFLRYIVISVLEVFTDFEEVALRGSTLVEVILVKGHTFPTIMKS